MPLPNLEKLKSLSKEQLVHEFYTLINDTEKLMKVIGEREDNADYYFLMVAAKNGLYKGKAGFLLSALFSAIKEICTENGAKYNSVLTQAMEPEKEDG